MSFEASSPITQFVSRFFQIGKGCYINMYINIYATQTGLYLAAFTYIKMLFHVPRHLSQPAANNCALPHLNESTSNFPLPGSFILCLYLIHFSKLKKHHP